MNPFIFLLNAFELILKQIKPGLYSSFPQAGKVNFTAFHHIDGYSVFTLIVHDMILNRVVIDRRHFEFDRPNWMEAMMRLDRVSEEAEKLGVKVLHMDVSAPISKELYGEAIVFTQHDD